MDYHQKYLLKTKELVDNSNIPKTDVFDYELSPHRDEFDDMFYFYQNTLDRDSKYGIVPSVFFFNNNTDVNAYATKTTNGYYVISINKGTIRKLINMFTEKTDSITNVLDEDFSNFEQSLDTSISMLMYLNAVHFTFYHEEAHLIQKSKFLENVICEDTQENGNYSLDKHILEIDADEFSSLSIGSHIFQYAETTFGEKITASQLEKLIIISCSSAFLYILSFNSNKGQNMYYEKKSHPHPIIRITWIVHTIVGYCVRNFIQNGSRLNLNVNDIVHKTLDFSQIISENVYQDGLIRNYLDIFEKEGVEIFAYLLKIEILKQNNKSLAVSKWNINVMNMQNSQRNKM
jgi:hypothetical protein